MKVIDLLNKIANGEEVPKKIKIGFSVLTLNDNKDNYLYEDSDEYYGDELIHWFNLNDEIEIIEETPKEDKKIEDTARFQYSQIPPWFDTKEVIRVVNENFERHQRALNEIIDKINGE